MAALENEITARITIPVPPRDKVIDFLFLFGVFQKI
jgi:hypothetical protein